MSTEKIDVASILQRIEGEMLNASPHGSSVDPAFNYRITKPASLEGADEASIAFYFSKKYREQLEQTRAPVIVTGHDFREELAATRFWREKLLIGCSDPYLAMAQVSKIFAPVEARTWEEGVDSRAFVDESARLGRKTSVGPGCVIERNVQIGDGVRIGANSWIGEGVEIGNSSLIFPGVKIYPGVKLGKEGRLHSGVVLGADGFGYVPVKRQGRIQKHQKIYHLGGVVIGDQVEIGANTCIDRGTFGNTSIGDQAKLDNLVQVGHNAQIGRGVIICGNVGIAGSAQIGEWSYVGGATGIADSVSIGRGAKIGAASLISQDVPDGETALGNPQRDYRTHFRVQAAMNRLVKGRKKRDESSRNR